MPELSKPRLILLGLFTGLGLVLVAIWFSGPDQKAVATRRLLNRLAGETEEEKGGKKKGIRPINR